MTRKLECELVTWGAVRRLALRVARAIHADGFAPDLVVAIGRGGYVPARLLCDWLDLTDLTSIRLEHYRAGSDKQPEAVIRFPLCCDIPQQQVLLVDDVNDTGDTLRAAVEHLRERGAAEVRVAVLHDKPGSRFRVDYHGQRIRGWRWLIYPWAVAEDVRGFLARHDGPREPEAARQWLETHFGIRLDVRQLADILQLARPGEPA